MNKLFNHLILGMHSIREEKNIAAFKSFGKKYKDHASKTIQNEKKDFKLISPISKRDIIIPIKHAENIGEANLSDNEMTISTEKLTALTGEFNLFQQYFMA